MAFRGRGRGRGGFGGGGFNFAPQHPFVLFPEIDLPDRNKVPEEKELAIRNYRFRNFFRNSPYYLEETLSDEDSVDIERYSDKVNKKARFGRESLLGSGVLKLENGYFPPELVQGTKSRTKRKVRWNQERDLRKLDDLEKLEKDFESGSLKGKKEKEGEEEEEEEDVEEEEEDEVDTDDDYAKGEQFDDDEDDFNVSEGDDEDAM
ncbi:unnamed protein product [Amaranthus hypochondriacus]